MKHETKKWSTEGIWTKKKGTYFQVNARAGRFSSTRWYSWAAKESPSSNGADAPFENSRLWNEERRKKTPERKKTTKKCVLVEVGSGWDGFSVKRVSHETRHAVNATDNREATGDRKRLNVTCRSSQSPKGWVFATSSGGCTVWTPNSFEPVMSELSQANLSMIN